MMGIRRRRALLLGSTMLGLAALLGGVAPALAQAGAGLPSGGAVVRGAGQIGQPAAGGLTIDQSTQRGVIDWRTFSIAAGNRVQINNASGATLNRVLGGELSTIAGQLSATGSLYLMNPNGVIVAAGGRVVAGGSFVASTRQMDMDAFMAGGPLRASGTSAGDIVNKGQVLARTGSVVLIGRSVTNAGLIEAPSGRVSLAAADDVLLATTDGKADNIFVSVGTGGGDITQDGRIEAAAAALQAADGNIFALAGKGVIRATGTETVDGELWLTAPKGTVQVTGALSAGRADGSGGKVVVDGREVVLAGSARLSAAGTRGGEVLVGTTRAGSGADLADSTTIAAGASIQAGGPLGGGMIETSGRALTLQAASISAGRGGQWLVDPDDLTIDAPAALTLTTSLNAGTNVTQQTTAGGTGGAGDITVAAPVVWTGSGGLTLTAVRDVLVNAQISGGGPVTLTAARNAAIGAPVSGTAATVTAGSLLSIAAAGRVSATGNVILTDATFTNAAGVSALSSTGGRWLVYSTDPASDSPGALAPAFYQYAAAHGATPAAAGNGLLYSLTPSISFLPGAVTKSYDGTTTATLTPANTAVTGVINGDAWTLDGVYGSKDAGTGLTVTASNFAATHNGAPVFGYAVPTPSVSVTTGTITRATLTASVINTPEKVYNGTTTATLASSNYAIAGVASGESVTVSDAASVAYDAADAGARTVNAVFTAPNFTAGSGTNLNNYILPTSATGAGLIDQAPLRITSVTANGKVYDGTRAGTLNTGSAALFGIVGSDDVTLSSGAAVGTFAAKNVGTGIAVTASGFALSGGKAANYALAQPTGLTADITKASIVVSSVLVNDKTYDGTTTATLNTASATFAGLISGDDVSVTDTGASINFVSKNAGTHIPITITGLALGGADGGNYSVAQPGTLNGNILKAPLAAAVTGNPTRVYNGTTTASLGPANYALTGFVAGEGASVVQTASASYASKNAGTWTVTAQISTPDFQADAGTVLSNYILPTSATGTGTITQAPIVMAIQGNPTKAYDGNTDAFLTPANYATSGFLAGEGVTVTQSHGVYGAPDAGTRTVTATVSLSDLAPDSGTLLSNYLFPTTVTGFGTITRVTLGGGMSIDASITGNPTKIYDGNTIAHLVPSDYTLTGWVNGDGATVTQTVGQYGAANAGAQAVRALLAPTDFSANSGTNLNNYNLPTEATGIGTINRATILAAITGNPTKVYDGTLTAQVSPSAYSFTGFVSGEGVSVADGVGVNYDSINAGARTVTANFVATSLTANAGTRLSNYILPPTATGPGTISKAPLTIVGVAANNKTYDTTTAATLNLGNMELFGVVAGDNVTLDSSGSSALFASKNVGNGIAVTASGFAVVGSGLGNYQLFQPTGLAANITRRDLTILNVTALDKIYDNTVTAQLSDDSAALSGVLGTDAVGLSTGSASAVFHQVNIGHGLTVTASGFALTGADAGNYALSQPGGLFANINPAPLVANIIGNPTKTYDGTVSVDLAASNYALTGFVAGQGASLPQSASVRYDLADAGSRTITSTLVSSDFIADPGTDLSNYLLPTTGSGAGTINRANLVAGIFGNPTKIYDSTTAATLASGNFQMNGFVTGQGATISQTAGTYDSKNAGARTVTASLSAGDFTGTGNTNLSNYNLPTTASGAGAITKASAAVIDVTAQNKVYDGGTAAALDSSLAALSGVFGGDTVSVVSTGASGQFADKNVATHIAVTASGYTLGGADAGNYTVVQPTGLFADISQATLTLASVTRVYDALLDVPTVSGAYTLSGVVGGDSVSVNAAGISGAYASKNVGTGIGVTLAGVALGGASAANYVIASTTTNAPIGVITPAALTVTGAVANDKVYDQTTLATLNNTNAGLSGVLLSDDVVLSSAGSSAHFNDANAGVAKPVVASGYTVSGGDASNYAFTQPQGLTATITPAPIVLTSVSKIYSADTALPTDGAAYGFSGVFSGDQVSANTSGLTGGYADKNVAGSLSGGVVTGGIDITLAGLSLTGASAGNYSISSTVTADPIGVISRKSLSASIVGTPTKVYDRTTDAALAAGNYAISGFVGGEGATVTQTVGLYDSLNAGSRTVTASLGGADFAANGGTLLSNYTLPVSANGAGLITPKPLTISGILATNKVYDGNRNDPLNTSGAQLVGVVAGDTTGLNSGGAAGLFADANVATHIAVTASGFALTNDPNGNYTLSQPTGLFADITQASLTLTKVLRVYTSGVELPTDTTAYTLAGSVAGDTVNVDTANIAGSYASKNVGSGIGVTLTGLALGGAQAGNYSIVSSLTNAAIGQITPASASLSGVQANAKPYDGTVTLTLNNGLTAVVGRLGSDVLGVDSTGSTASFPSANAGTYSVAASGYVLTGADAGNYILTQPSGISATINPALLTAAIIGAPNKTYDGNAAALLAAGNYQITGFVSGEGASVTRTAGLYDLADAGNRTVSTTLASGDFTATGATLLSNYVLPTTASGAGHIDQALLTASIIGNPTKTYDASTAATLTSANYSLSGFVSGQGATVTQTAGLYALADAGNRTVTATLAGGDFTANSGTSLANYVLPVSASGAGRINQALLTASIIGAPNKTYDGTAAATLASANYSLAGFVSGQGATVTQTSGLYSLADAGNRTVTATLAGGDFTANGGTLLANYVLPTTASGAGHIDQAQLAASIVGTPTKVYDGTAAASLFSSNYGLSGFVAGQGATVTQGAGLYDQADAGSRTVSTTLAAADFTANSGTSLANYILPTTASGAGRVLQASLNVSIVGTPTKTYDGAVAAALSSANYALTGFVAGQGATVTQTSGLYASPNAGSRTVTATLGGSFFTANSGTNLGNYILPVIASGSGLINQALLTASIIGTPNKTYNGTAAATLAAGNYQLSGFVSGQGASVTQTAGLYDLADAGSRTVTATLGGGDFTANGGTLLANYVLPATASGAGRIDPALLTASIVGDPTRTYDATTAAALTSANYSLSGFVAGQGASVTQTVGAYDLADVGSRSVTASLAGGDFAANSGTRLANYVLPTTASGAGHIDPALLTASIVGTPTKTYDGANPATLTSANYSLSGFFGGQGASVSHTAGVYDDPNAGVRTVSAALSSGDFTATGGTLFSNYILPTTASGPGLIDRAPLTANIVGDPTRDYNGDRLVLLTPANFTLTGFVGSDGGTVAHSLAFYDDPNVGLRNISANLVLSDFAGNPGTVASNYALPTTANGTGHITPAALTALLSGVSKAYDGTTNALLLPGAYTLVGFAGGEGAVVVHPAGQYASADAGTHLVTASLDPGDFVATGGALFSNYILPTTATGLGRIDPALLTATIVGMPTRTYDGTTAIGLTPGNYLLSGFAASEGATVREDSGAYDSPNAGSRTVTAALGRLDFRATGSTQLSNYVLPDIASGAGRIDPAVLAASIIGNPTKVSDGTTVARLTSANYALTGFIAGEGASVTQTLGAYDSANIDARTVTALLASGDYAPSGVTLLANYVLPVSASGPGTITSALLGRPLTPITPTVPGQNPVVPSPPGSPCAFELGDGCVIDRPDFAVFANAATYKHFYVPYPSGGSLYTGSTAGFAGLPAIMTTPQPPAASSSGDIELGAGQPVINSTERILLQGDKDKRWRISFTPPAVPTSLAAAGP